MTRSTPIIATAALLLSARAEASLTSVYVAQAASGSADGSSCANAKAASFLKSGGSWGSGASQIGPGSTVHLCGTLTSSISVQGSGSSSQPLTVTWEPSASVAVCDTTGAVVLAGQSNVVLDLGGNPAAITCPDNGTGMATQVIAVGVSDGFGGSFDHVEVKNGTIGPIYQKSGTGGDGLSTYGIYLDGGSGNRFHDLSFTDAEKGVFFALSGTSSSNEIDHDSFQKVGAGIYYACGGNDCSDSGGRIHANDFLVGINWGGPGDFTHMESIHVFSNGAGSSIADLLIYDNFTHGPWPAVGGTAAIFVEQAQPGVGNGTQSGQVFDNICQMTGGTTGPGDGCIFLASNGNDFGLYNNLSDCGDPANSIGKGMELDGNDGNTFVAENNIVLNCNTAVYNPGAKGSLTLDANDYFNVGSSGWWWQGTSYATFAAWQSASGQDAHSTIADPGLHADYTLVGASSAAHAAGLNLTSLSTAPLDVGKPTNVGAGATATGANRPAAGAWDLGPYPLGSASPPDGGAGGDGGDAGSMRLDGSAGDGSPDAGRPHHDGGVLDGGDLGPDGGDAGSSSSPGVSSGCGCVTARAPAGGLAFAELALPAIALLRRRSRRDGGDRRGDGGPRAR